MNTDNDAAIKALNNLISTWARQFNIERVELVWDAWADSLSVSSLSTDSSSISDDNPVFARHFEVTSPLGFKPIRATKGSAGYDLRSPVNIVIHPNETIAIDSGVRVFMNTDEVLLIYPRSSVAMNKNLVLKNSVSVIDSDFHNEISILVTNIGKDTQFINRGDKIAQAVFQKFLTTNDNPTKTRSGGIGSTGN